MNVAELRDYLKTCNSDTEVRLAEQPGQMIEYSICWAIEVVTDDNRRIVYLVEGDEIGSIDDDTLRYIGV